MIGGAWSLGGGMGLFGAGLRRYAWGGSAILGVSMGAGAGDLKDESVGVLPTGAGADGKGSGGEAEREAIARLRALAWVRPGNGERVAPVARPIPAGPPGAVLLSELLLRDRG